jgi:hypothetical protein
MTPSPQPYQRPYQTPKTPSVSEKKKDSSATPKKYTPPSITRNAPSQPKVQSQPPAPAPSAPAKNKDASTPPGADYNFYPLPGSKPTAEKDSSPSSTTARDNSSSGSANKGVGAAGSGSFLKGKRTNKAGRVISPYAPYQELDVTGLSSGSLALDPTTQKVFEVP